MSLQANTPPRHSRKRAAPAKRPRRCWCNPFCGKLLSDSRRRAHYQRMGLEGREDERAMSETETEDELGSSDSGSSASELPEMHTEATGVSDDETRSSQDTYHEASEDSEDTRSEGKVSHRGSGLAEVNTVSFSEAGSQNSSVQLPLSIEAEATEDSSGDEASDAPSRLGSPREERADMDGLDFEDGDFGDYRLDEFVDNQHVEHEAWLHDFRTFSCTCP